MQLRNIINLKKVKIMLDPYRYLVLYSYMTKGDKTNK